MILQLSELEILAGDIASARARLAVFDTASDLESAFLLAQAELGDGRPEAALAQLQAIGANLPQAPLALLIFQVRALRALSRDAEALLILRQIVAQAPRLVDVHAQLIELLFAAGDVPGTREALSSALRANPSSSLLWQAYGNFTLHNGDHNAAEQAFRKSTELDPANVSAWLALGRLLMEHARHAESAKALLQAVKIAPGDAAIEALLGHASQELGDIEQALQAYGRANARGSTDLSIATGEALLLPQIYRDRADVQHWRERFRTGLERLNTMVPDQAAWKDQVLLLQRTNFLLAYQGQDDRELQRGYSQLLRSLTAEALPDLVRKRTATFDGQRKLRVGFASSHLCNSTAGLYFERWITGLDPARFERCVFDLGSFPDAINARIRASVEHFKRVNGSLDQIARQIAAMELDVLIYPEVGMDCNIYLLATLRLAPVQCAGWGHPVTTGSSEIDYYISCAEMEPPGAEQHYVERLLLLPGIGVDYPRPEARNSAKRSDFSLPEDKRLYFCPQSLFKVHPDMDQLLARVIAADPDAILVMFQGGPASITNAFTQRFQESMLAHGVTPRSQLKLLPRMGAAEFRGALSLADVVLDTVHWSGGNTSLDAFAAGVPVVSLPGEFMRGRQTMGMLRLLDLEALIAESEDGYVNLAVRVATDTAWRSDLVKQLLTRRERLFNRADAVQELQATLLQIAQQH